MTGIKEEDFGKIVSRGFSDALYYLAPFLKKLCCDINLRCELAKNNLDLETKYTVQDCTRIMSARELLKKIFDLGNRQLMEARTVNPEYPKEDKAIKVASEMWDGLHSELQAALNACRKCFEKRFKIEVSLENKTVGEYHEP